jgi:hypothetical protein
MTLRIGSGHPRLFPSRDDLAEQIALESGYTCDLHIDTGDLRVWWSRCSVADGEPFENTIYIEAKTSDGRWVEALCYDGEDPPTDPQICDLGNDEKILISNDLVGWF